MYFSKISIIYLDGQKLLENSEDHIKDIVHRLYAALHMDEFQVRTLGYILYLWLRNFEMHKFKKSITNIC